MNNLLAYFGLVDARINASEKDLPVLFHFENISINQMYIKLEYAHLFFLPGEYYPKKLISYIYIFKIHFQSLK